MALTEFLQVKDNAKTLAPLGSLANITASLTVNGIDTSSFPAVTTGYIVTIWNDVTYPEPSDDPNMEKATVTATTIGANGSFTLLRTNPKVHVGTPRIALLVLSQHITEIQDAIHEIQDAVAQPSLYLQDANGVQWTISGITTDGALITSQVSSGTTGLYGTAQYNTDNSYVYA